jgi:quercetin dioxygenase-like cupin family protein
VRFTLFEDLDEYEPHGHQGVVNRLLVGRENLDIEAVSVWHGRLEPGGRSDLHVHDSSLQIYVGITGEMIVGDGDRQEILLRLSTVVFDAGTNHFIENRSSDWAEVLVVSVPGLK